VHHAAGSATLPLASLGLILVAGVAFALSRERTK
jgi:hypothetical protein